MEMKDDFSKVDISKTDITGDTELVGVKLQVLNSKEEVLDEWISDGTEHPIEYALRLSRKKAVAVPL